MDTNEDDKEEADDGNRGNIGEQAQRMHIRSNKRRDSSGANRILDQDGEPGQRATHLAHGAAGKAITSTSCGHSRGHFSQAQHHEQIHGSHDQECDKHSEPATVAYAVVPSRKVTGYYVGNAQAHKQYPVYGALLKGALFKVFFRFCGYATQNGGICWRCHKAITPFA